MRQMKQTNSRRGIPSVEKVLQALGGVSLPRPLVLRIVRSHLAKLRSEGGMAQFDELIESLRGELRKLELTRLQPVINGTGILIHTNFGRSPLAAAALEAIDGAGKFYNNLEYDLGAGERGQRGAYLEELLAHLCEAEAATVVNNCAAALVLILHHCTRERREVIISRGELVQIGGGFRIPDILKHAGAVLREVGTTNKTSLADYQEAISAQTGLILKVHRSNFAMSGFVDSPSREELTRLAHEGKLLFVEDLGSGAISAEAFATLDREPTPAECIRAGVDLVCFSGDKLFGGPQAGIIVGRLEAIRALKKDPLFRALRCDKLIMAGLQATAELWATEADRGSLPLVQMIRADAGQLRKRAENLMEELGELPLDLAIGSGSAEAGGGALPGATFESVTLDVRPKGATLEEFASRLREGHPPVVGYIAKGVFKLDLRTIFPEQEGALLEAIRQAVQTRPI